MTDISAGRSKIAQREHTRISNVPRTACPRTVAAGSSFNGSFGCWLVIGAIGEVTHASVCELNEFPPITTETSCLSMDSKNATSLSEPHSLYVGVNGSPAESWAAMGSASTDDSPCIVLAPYILPLPNGS